jgi:ATP diphosphatase
MKASREISRLIELVAAMRTPGSGCPWDLAQTFDSVVRFAIEEAYEVADAVARNDYRELRKELGDLLFQVAFQARLAEEAGFFDFGDVVQSITEKMIKRHPHVFGNERRGSWDELESLWEKVKAEEKCEKEAARRKSSVPEIEFAVTSDNGSVLERVLDGVTLALPGLTRAVKLQDRAASVGFDWNDPRLVLAKVREEINEVEAVLDGREPDALADEVGDLFFAVANLARHVRTDPEASIRRANEKFERRFRYIEQELWRVGRDCRSASLDEMEALWDGAKKREKS